MPADAVWALEIVPHDQDVDPRARAARQALADLGAGGVGVRHGRLYVLAAPQSPELTQAALALCLDPILAESCPGELAHSGEGWVIERLKME